MNTWRKRLAYLVGVLALVMTGMGCRMNQHETVEQPPPAYAPTKEGGTLVIARMSDANNLDPHFISTINAASVVYQQVYEGLVTRSMNMEIQPQLATAWIQIDDMTWEFKLRKGVFFQDGTPFNATAVKKTLDRVLDPQVRSTRAAMFDKLKEVKIVDDHTVLLILTEPFVPLLSILASHEGSMISPKAIEEYGKDLSKHPVGTGPFTFHSWIPGQEIVMVKNRNYWGQAPKIDKLIFRIIVDDNERINLVRNNQAQVAESVPVDEIEKIQASPEMNVYRSEALGTEFVGFNVSREP
ncbi:MAG: glutathione transporter substrate-binding protein, partial [Brevibacillus sp.]|nr:glutathione transporter substrate-binding protein [Brevibacillus sp.]